MSGEWLAVIHFPQLSQLAGRRTSPSSHECQFLGEGAEFRSNTKSAVYEGTEDKCEPVYTNCTACVALWTRPANQLPIVRDLRPIPIGLEIAYVRWQWVQGVAGLTGTKLYSTTHLEASKN